MERFYFFCCIRFVLCISKIVCFLCYSVIFFAQVFFRLIFSETKKLERSALPTTNGQCAFCANRLFSHSAPKNSSSRLVSGSLACPDPDFPLQNDHSPYKLFYYCTWSLVGTLLGETIKSEGFTAALFEIRWKLLMTQQKRMKSKDFRVILIDFWWS